MVRDHDGAVDAVELAEQMGLHVTTVRFHLDALCNDGVVVRTRMNRPGVGRPRTGYLPVEQRVDYQALAEVLAMELGQNAETRARRAQQAGKKWAARMTAAQPWGDDRTESAPAADAHDPLDRAAVHATAAFTWMGFAPELEPAAKRTSRSSTKNKSLPLRERVIRLHSCPVRELAQAHPEVVCGVHRGLLQGLLDEVAVENDAGPAMSAHLEPFVEPELCTARLALG